jgi:hypothetical protein
MYKLAYSLCNHSQSRTATRVGASMLPTPSFIAILNATKLRINLLGLSKNALCARISICTHSDMDI